MAYGVPTPSQLEKINQLAKRPLEKEEVFVFSSKLIGDALIQERMLKIHRSLLEVFRDDAKKGVAFLLDHSWAGFARPKPALVYGRSFDARMKKGDFEGESHAVHADFYIVRGREKDGISTDQIIADIEDGVLFDTSIGWGADTFECSICGNDYRDYSKCDHYMGREYDGKLCYVIAKPPGFLMENSGVFDGAYPTAGILSADGSISGDGNVLVVEDYKTVRPGVPMFHTYSATRNSIVSYVMKDDITEKVYLQKPAIKEGDKVDVLKELGFDTEQIEVVENGFKAKDGKVYMVVPEEEVKAKEELQKQVDDLQNELDKLRPKAEEGEAYRNELIQDTIEWGIRAHGDKFDKETWEAILKEEGRTIEQIKNFRNQFKEESKEFLKSGKKTKFNDNNDDEPVISIIDDEAYQG